MRFVQRKYRGKDKLKNLIMNVLISSIIVLLLSTIVHELVKKLYTVIGFGGFYVPILAKHAITCNRRKIGMFTLI
mgnify:CR=1 FL=1